MVTFLALWVPSDKNKQKSWPCMRSRPAGVNRFDQILDISKHLCGIVSDNNMIHCIHYGISLQDFVHDSSYFLKIYLPKKQHCFVIHHTGNTNSEPKKISNKKKRAPCIGTINFIQTILKKESVRRFNKDKLHLIKWKRRPWRQCWYTNRGHLYFICNV